MSHLFNTYFAVLCVVRTLTSGDLLLSLKRIKDKRLVTDFKSQKNENMKVSFCIGYDDLLYSISHFNWHSNLTLLSKNYITTHKNAKKICSVFLSTTRHDGWGIKTLFHYFLSLWPLKIRKEYWKESTLFYPLLLRTVDPHRNGTYKIPCKYFKYPMQLFQIFWERHHTL